MILPPALSLKPNAKRYYAALPELPKSLIFA